MLSFFYSVKNLNLPHPNKLYSLLALFKYLPLLDIYFSKLGFVFVHLIRIASVATKIITVDAPKELAV